MCGATAHVCFVPIADIRKLQKTGTIDAGRAVLFNLQRNFAIRKNKEARALNAV